jgi:hypothetical protein
MDALDWIAKLTRGEIAADELVRALATCEWRPEYAGPLGEAAEALASGEARMVVYEFLLATPVPRSVPRWVRLNYLYALNNACIRAAELGDNERAAVIADLGSAYMRENPHIAHSAACAYVAVGRLDDAMWCVRRAVKYEYRRLGSLRIDDELAPLRGRPGFPTLSAADRARFEDIENATPETALAALGRAGAKIWDVRARWSEDDWYRLYAAALPYLAIPALDQAAWRLLCSALHYGIGEIRKPNGVSRVLSLLQPALDPMFRRAPDRLEELAKEAGVALLALPELEHWLDELAIEPWTDTARITIRQRTKTTSLTELASYLHATAHHVRATAAEAIARVCAGSFLGEPDARLDAHTLDAIAASETDSPGILWSFLGHLWRNGKLDAITEAAGVPYKDWVFALLARSPESWVYEEFFSTQDDVVRLLRLGRDHQAMLAALEHGLDLEAARRDA